MIDVNFINHDFSEETSLGKDEIRKLLVKTQAQKEELIAALVRYLFANYAGKNLLVKYQSENGAIREICAICRGMKFHVYSPDSEYVYPQEYSFSDIVDSLRKRVESLDDIVDFSVLSDKEATEFIRVMYQKRAEESKKYLAKILVTEAK